MRFPFLRPPSLARLVILAIGLALGCESVFATNYDEAKAGSYLLPNPLVCADGSPVTLSLPSWARFTWPGAAAATSET